MTMSSTFNSSQLDIADTFDFKKHNQRGSRLKRNYHPAANNLPSTNYLATKREVERKDYQPANNEHPTEYLANIFDFVTPPTKYTKYQPANNQQPTAYLANNNFNFETPPTKYTKYQPANNQQPTVYLANNNFDFETPPTKYTKYQPANNQQPNENLANIFDFETPPTKYTKYQPANNQQPTEYLANNNFDFETSSANYTKPQPAKHPKLAVENGQSYAQKPKYQTNHETENLTNVTVLDSDHYSNKNPEHFTKKTKNDNPLNNVDYLGESLDCYSEDEIDYFLNHDNDYSFADDDSYCSANEIEYFNVNEIDYYPGDDFEYCTQKDIDHYMENEIKFYISENFDYSFIDNPDYYTQRQSEHHVKEETKEKLEPPIVNMNENEIDQSRLPNPRITSRTHPLVHGRSTLRSMSSPRKTRMKWNEYRFVLQRTSSSIRRELTSKNLQAKFYSRQIEKWVKKFTPKSRRLKAKEYKEIVAAAINAMSSSSSSARAPVQPLLTSARAPAQLSSTSARALAQLSSTSARALAQLSSTSARAPVQPLPTSARAPAQLASFSARARAPSLTSSTRVPNPSFSAATNFFANQKNMSTAILHKMEIENEEEQEKELSDYESNFDPIVPSNYKSPIFTNDVKLSNVFSSFEVNYHSYEDNFPPMEISRTSLSRKSCLPSNDNKSRQSKRLQVSFAEAVSFFGCTETAPLLACKSPSPRVLSDSDDDSFDSFEMEHSRWWSRKKWSRASFSSKGTRY